VGAPPLVTVYDAPRRDDGDKENSKIVSGLRISAFPPSRPPHRNARSSPLVFKSEPPLDMFERSGRFWRCAFELNPRQIERILHSRDVPLELVVRKISSHGYSA
jgi:hypothetical protein